MHYLVVTFCFSGDLVPFINFALEARAAGIRITFAVEIDDLARYAPFRSRLELFELIDTKVGAGEPLVTFIGEGTFWNDLVARLRVGSQRYAPYYRRLRAKLDPFFATHKPDLVVAHYRALAALDLAKDAGVPCVVLSPCATRPSGFGGRPVWWWRGLQVKLPILLRPLCAVALFGIDLWLLFVIRSVRREYGVSAPLEFYPSNVRWVETTICGYSEAPIALPLHEALVGPLLSPAWEDPMPPGLADWLDSRTAVIYVAFGGVFSLPEGQWRLFLQAVSALHCHVLIRHPDLKQLDALICSTVPEADRPRVAVIDWAQQRQILAHPHVTLFITHAGQGSVLESIFYGKPVIAVPLHGDQHYNAQRLTQCGIGVCIPASFTGPQLAAAIRQVLVDPLISRNALYYQLVARSAGGVKRMLEICHEEGLNGPRYVRSAPITAWGCLFPIAIAILACAAAFGVAHGQLW